MLQNADESMRSLQNKKKKGAGQPACGAGSLRRTAPSTFPSLHAWAQDLSGKGDGKVFQSP